MISSKIKRWFLNQKRKHKLKVKIIDINNIKGWILDRDKIYHKSKKFFKIIGIKISTNFYKYNWDQPIIVQNEIGILGIINSSIPELMPKSKLGQSSFSFEVEAIEKWVPDMKKNGCDVVIVLTSSGVPWDREDIYDVFINNPSKSKSLNAIEMGYYANGVDLIISGGIS